MDIQIKDKQIPSISPESFIFELYEPNCWSALDLSFEQSLDDEQIAKKIYQYAVGYCDASRLYVRPRTDTYAFMFEKAERKFWFHVSKVVVEYYEMGRNENGK